MTLQPWVFSCDLPAWRHRSKHSTLHLFRRQSFIARSGRTTAEYNNLTEVVFSWAGLAVHQRSDIKGTQPNLTQPDGTKDSYREVRNTAYNRTFLRSCVINSHDASKG